jgi:hypothetical protein
LKQNLQSLRLAHGYGDDQILAPNSILSAVQTYTLPGRSGVFALNDGVNLGVSGSNVILGRITGISGSSNTGAGYLALTALTSGVGNTVFGASAGRALSNASGNTCIGSEALRYSNGADNTAVGARALLLCTSGTSNTAVGTEALNGIVSGTQSSGFGYNAGRYLSGGGNTLIGSKTGLSSGATAVAGQVNLTTGVNNTIVGSNAGVTNAARKQAIVLGKDATAQNDGELVLGAASTTIRGGPTGTTPTGLTGAITAPANTTTPVGWLEVRVNGTLFKTPLYQ